MKSLITMMNAMKYYKHDELIQENEDFQEKLTQDLALPIYHKMMDKIREKYFLNRK